MRTDEPEDVMDVQDGDSTEESAPPADPSADSLRVLEALLFASDELLTATRLKAILPGIPDARQIRKMVDKLNVQFQKERHPFEIVEIGGGYQFRTVAYYHPWVRQIFKEKAAKKLSFQALECLAIIAYKQPISKAEIEAIRGVISDGAMKTLLEKRLATIAGRSDKPGRPLLYATTQDFLKYFGLNKIADLPRIEEFEALAREKMEELSVEELQQQETESGAVEGSEDQGAATQPAAPPEDSAVFEVAATSAPEQPVEEDAADFEPATPVSAPEDGMGESGEADDEADEISPDELSAVFEPADAPERAEPEESTGGSDEAVGRDETAESDEADFEVSAPPADAESLADDEVSDETQVAESETVAAAVEAADDEEEETLEVRTPDETSKGNAKQDDGEAEFLIKESPDQ